MEKISYEEVLESIKKLDKLEKKFREASKNIYHSRKLVVYDKLYISYDLRDILLCGPLTNSNILFVGKSGTAKTHLALCLCSALFGKDYAFLPVNSNLSEEKLRDISFKTLKKGGNLSDAIKRTKLTEAPAVILDEVNMAPKEVLNILKNYLQNGLLVFEGGKEIKPGVKIENEIYQFKIGTCNEGPKYAVTQMEKAYRDRFAIEIRIDSFPMEAYDEMCLEDKIVTTSLNVPECESELETVLELYQIIKKIELDGVSKSLMRYLSRMSNCIKSKTKNKEDIEFSQELCKGCHPSREFYNICGNVFAPTNRTRINLKKMGQAFALLRAYKIAEKLKQGYLNKEVIRRYYKFSERKKLPKGIEKKFIKDYLSNLKVTFDDLKMAAPFVLVNKLDMNKAWVKKHFQGNEFIAIKFLINCIEEKIKRYYKECWLPIKEKMLSEPYGVETKKILKRYFEKDPWSIDIHSLEQSKEPDDFCEKFDIFS